MYSTPPSIQTRDTLVTSLMIACSRGDANMANALISAGAGMMCCGSVVRNKLGETPVHISVHGLLLSGDFYDAPEKKKRQAKNKDASLLKILLDDVSSNVDDFERMMSNYFAPDYYGRSPLHTAAAIGDDKVMAQLCGYIKEKGMLMSHDDVTKRTMCNLLSVRDLKGLTPLAYAAMSGNTVLSKMIIDELKRASEDYLTVVQMRGYDKMTEHKCLMDTVNAAGMGAVSDNVYTAEGPSPLQLSAMAGHADIVTMLMDIGARLEMGEVNSLMRVFATTVSTEHTKMVTKLNE